MYYVLFTRKEKPAFEHIIKLKKDVNIRRLGFIRPTQYLYNLIKTSYIKEKVSQFISDNLYLSWIWLVSMGQLTGE